MRPPEPRARVYRVALILAALAGIAPVYAQELVEGLGENWFRTELLVFVREDQESRTAQQYDPLPELAYPARYRYFIDPQMADRRLAESRAFASRIDDEGRQYLSVPAPFEMLLEHNRPDVLTEDPAALLPELEAVPDASQSGVIPDPNAALPGDMDTGVLSANTGEPIPDPNAPVLALPYELLDAERLSFAQEARSLRRQGHRVLLHETWWAQLQEGDEPEWLVLDQAGDLDTPDWPSLQGALRVYRSRYLHAEVDLWLNTMGDYLPRGWKIPAPPLAQPSLLSQTLGGVPVDPWSPLPLVPEPAAIDFAIADPNDPPDPNAPDVVEDPAADYPWRHAIVHRQSRRMRSGEIHYLDHPVIGVVVRVTPASEDDLPLIHHSVLEFRERHSLPVQRLDSELLPEPR